MRYRVAVDKKMVVWLREMYEKGFQNEYGITPTNSILVNIGLKQLEANIKNQEFNVKYKNGRLIFDEQKS